MCFEFPERLVAFWLLLPLAGVMAYGVWKQLSARRRLADVSLTEGLLGKWSVRREAGLRALQFAAFSLLLAAWCGPRLCSGERPVRRDALDVAYVLDVSNSMLARDVSPDRLARAKRVISRIDAGYGRGRRSLVAFAGSAVLQCPLTYDRQAFDAMLDAAVPALLEAQGTDLRQALETALRALGGGSKGAKRGAQAVVLVTDGENHAGGGPSFGRMLGARGVRLAIIGIGREAPVAIPAAGGDVMADASGEPVRTSFEPGELSAVAENAGGIFLHGAKGGDTAERVVDYLERIDAGERWTSEPLYGTRLYPYFVLLAVALLLTSEWAGRRSAGADERYGARS